MNDLTGQRLKVAFLGGGVDSAIGQVHRIAIEMDRRFELIAGCFSRESTINEASALNYGVSKSQTYSNLDDLLKETSARIDAIIILTPTDQHRDQVMTCLTAGLPVICEKALVNSTSDAQQIRATLESRTGFLAVTYNYTAYPMLRELRNLVTLGTLGKINQVHLEMPQEGFARLGAEGKPGTPQDWRLRDGYVPTVSLDLGVHLHSLMSFLTGEKPVRLVSMQNSFGHFHPIIDNVLCMAMYSNEIEASLWYGKTALGYRNGLRLRVFGEIGSAEWAQENPEYLRVTDSKGRNTILDRSSTEVTIANQPRYTRFKVGHPAGFIEAFANYYLDVADALEIYKRERILRLRPYVFGIDEALEGIAMMEAIAASSEAKSWIEIKP